MTGVFFQNVPVTAVRLRVIVALILLSIISPLRHCCTDIFSAMSSSRYRPAIPCPTTALSKRISLVNVQHPDAYEGADIALQKFRSPVFALGTFLALCVL